MLPGALLPIYKHAVITILFLIREGKKNRFDCPFDYFSFFIPPLQNKTDSSRELRILPFSTSYPQLSLYNLLYLGNPEDQFLVSTLSDVAVASDAGDNPIKLETLSSLGSQDTILSQLTDPPSHSFWLTHSSSLSIIELLKCPQ